MARFNVHFLAALRRSTFFTLLTIAIVCLSLKLVLFKKPVHNPLLCYRSKNKALPDFSDVNPKKESIYFFDTSCVSDTYNKIVISKHSACSVESAARANPNTDVYLLFTSPGIIKNEGTPSDRYLETLLTYPNIKIHYLNFEKYVRNTPVEDLFKNGTIESSMYPFQHSIDVLSYLTLWKHGGTYINLDTIVLKSLEHFSPNYVSIPAAFLPSTVILNLKAKGQGRYFARLFLEHLRNNFRKDDFLHNGPGVFMRSLKEECRVNAITERTLRNCGKFNMYTSKFFFPMSWLGGKDTPRYKEYILAVEKKAYAVHLWNRNLFEALPIPKNRSTLYIRFVKKYCPKVYSKGEFF